MTESLADQLNAFKPRLENKLQQLMLAQRDACLANPAQNKLVDALEYSALGAGKRLRAMLVYLTARCIADASEPIDDACDSAAAAIELLHCYSLVHDDLPAMDDDDMRRGKPSCHIAYGEASAILAGDALQALAFESLADSNAPASSIKEQLKVLASAAGTVGMVGGQAIDLAATGERLDLEALCNMHKLKTGALIEAAVALGASCASASQTQRQALQQYAQSLGLAFQIRDDVLDVKGSPSETGKAAGADAALNKSTFTSLMGVEAAEAYTQTCIASAIAALVPLGSPAAALTELAHYVAERRY